MDERKDEQAREPETEAEETAEVLNEEASTET